MTVDLDRAEQLAARSRYILVEWSSSPDGVVGTGHDVGSAQVVDRTTGDRIGFVLADHRGHWHAWLVGAYAPLVVERYRRDAVAAVWDAHRTTEPRP